MITSMNTRVDAFTELDRLPLERIIEVHVSGMNLQSGVVWDDHAAPAPPEMFDLLERVMQRVQPLTDGIQLVGSPAADLLSDIARTRKILAQT